MNLIFREVEKKMLVLSHVKPRSLSPEEEAELARSNKKVKEMHLACFVEDEPPSFERTSKHPKLSFKEKLVREILGAYTQAFDFTGQMDNESDSDDDISELREGGY